MQTISLLLMILFLAVSLNNIQIWTMRTTIPENSRSLECKGNASSKYIHVFWTFKIGGTTITLSYCPDKEAGCVDERPNAYRANVSRKESSFRSVLNINDLNGIAANNSIFKCSVEDIGVSPDKLLIASWKICDVYFFPRFQPSFGRGEAKVYRVQEGTNIIVECSVQGFVSEAIAIHIKCKTASKKIFWDHTQKGISQNITVNGSDAFDGSTCVCAAHHIASGCSYRTTLSFDIKPAGYVRSLPEGRPVNTALVIIYVGVGFAMVNILIAIFAKLALINASLRKQEEGTRSVTHSRRSIVQEGEPIYEEVEDDFTPMAESESLVSSNIFFSDMAATGPLIDSSFHVEDNQSCHTYDSGIEVSTYHVSYSHLDGNRSPRHRYENNLVAEMTSEDNYIRAGSCHYFSARYRAKPRIKRTKRSCTELALTHRRCVKHSYSDSQGSAKIYFDPMIHSVFGEFVSTARGFNRHRQHKNARPQRSRAKRNGTYMNIENPRKYCLLKAHNALSASHVVNSHRTPKDVIVPCRSPQGMHKQSRSCGGGNTTEDKDQFSFDTYARGRDNISLFHHRTS